MNEDKEHKGCPVVDPLEEIKYKCDVIHSENMMIMQYLGQVMDKLLLVEQKFDEMDEPAQLDKIQCTVYEIKENMELMETVILSVMKDQNEMDKPTQ